MAKKIVSVCCEYCNQPYKKAKVDKSDKALGYSGGYCNRCSKISNKLTEVQKVDALFKVKKGDRAFLINGKAKFELWNYEDPFNEYTIKLYKKHKDIVKK